jgi:hypothetical protein
VLRALAVVRFLPLVFGIGYHLAIHLTRSEPTQSRFIRPGLGVSSAVLRLRQPVQMASV